MTGQMMELSRHVLLPLTLWTKNPLMTTWDPSDSWKDYSEKADPTSCCDDLTPVVESLADLTGDASAAYQ